MLTIKYFEVDGININIKIDNKIYKEGIGIKTSNGVIIITSLQPEGKSKMMAKDFLNGIKEDLVGRIAG